MKKKMYITIIALDWERKLIRDIQHNLMSDTLYLYIDILILKKFIICNIHK
jgi:hypothetical protein